MGRPDVSAWKSDLWHCAAVRCDSSKPKQPVANDGLLESLSDLVGLVPVAGEHVQQPAEAGDEGRDVGVRGGVEGLFYADHFILFDDA